MGSPGPRTYLCGNREEEECLAVVGLRPVQIVLSDPQAAVAATVTRMHVQQPSTPACTHGTVVNPPCKDTRHLITHTPPTCAHTRAQQRPRSTCRRDPRPLSAPQCPACSNRPGDASPRRTQGCCRTRRQAPRLRHRQYDCARAPAPWTACVGQRAAANKSAVVVRAFSSCSLHTQASFSHKQYPARPHARPLARPPARPPSSSRSLAPSLFAPTVRARCAYALCSLRGAGFVGGLTS